MAMNPLPSFSHGSKTTTHPNNPSEQQKKTSKYKENKQKGRWSQDQILAQKTRFQKNNEQNNYENCNPRPKKSQQKVLSKAQHDVSPQKKGLPQRAIWQTEDHNQSTLPQHQHQQKKLQPIGQHSREEDTSNWYPIGRTVQSSPGITRGKVSGYSRQVIQSSPIQQSQTTFKLHRCVTQHSQYSWQGLVSQSQSVRKLFQEKNTVEEEDESVIEESQEELEKSKQETESESEEVSAIHLGYRSKHKYLP